ncbi:MAG: SWIM zinc finger family protein [Methanoregula sp.]|nr:SWIM zinc finger family protein [Methanoregula sp.]
MSDPLQELKEKKVLDEPARTGIVKEFGTRGQKALEFIDQHRIKKYLDFFVVSGSRKEYVVSENVCTCPDFAFRQNTCAHILAVRIAEITGLYEPVDAWYQETWKQ